MSLGEVYTEEVTVGVMSVTRAAYVTVNRAVVHLVTETNNIDIFFRVTI